MKQHTKLKVGDKVEWSSSAAGSTKTKRGTVVEVIPAGRHWQDGVLCLRHNAHSTYGGGMRRTHESYAVLVPHPGDGKPTLYWPRVSALKKIG